METSIQCTQCAQCEQLKQDVMDLLVLCEKLREMLEEAENKIELNSDINTQFYCPNCGYEWGCVLGKPGKEFGIASNAKFVRLVLFERKGIKHMKHVLKWFDKFVLGLALVALLVSLGVCLYYRITHPDATDFRCFLETWPFAVLAMTSFFYLVYRTKNGW